MSKNISICQQYVDRAREAVEEWDGVSTAELFVLILQKTGEDESRLQDAMHKWRIESSNEEAGR